MRWHGLLKMLNVQLGLCGQRLIEEQVLLPKTETWLNRRRKAQQLKPLGYIHSNMQTS